MARITSRTFVVWLLGCACVAGCATRSARDDAGRDPAAAPTGPEFALPSREEIASLTRPQRAALIEALRAGALDAAVWQKQNGMQASDRVALAHPLSPGLLSPGQRTPAAAKPRKAAASGVPGGRAPAPAASGLQHCARAGWILPLEEDGSCPRPPAHPNKVCSSKQDWCNPAVYGADKCAPADASVERSCSRVASLPGKVASWLLRPGNEKDWDSFRSQLAIACPGAPYSRTCFAFWSRLGEAEMVFGVPIRVAPPSSRLAPGRAHAMLETADESRVPASLAAPSRMPATGPAAAAPRAAAPGSQPAVSRACHGRELLANIRVPGAPMDGVDDHLMTLEQAKALICSTNGFVNRDWIKERRQLIQARRRNSSIQAIGGSVGEGGRPSDYPSQLLSEYEANLMACEQKALEMRRSGAAPQASPTTSMQCYTGAEGGEFCVTAGYTSSGEPTYITMNRPEVWLGMGMHTDDICSLNLIRAPDVQWATAAMTAQLPPPRTQTPYPAYPAYQVSSAFGARPTADWRDTALRASDLAAVAQAPAGASASVQWRPASAQAATAPGAGPQAGAQSLPPIAAPPTITPYVAGGCPPGTAISGLGCIPQAGGTVTLPRATATGI